MMDYIIKVDGTTVAEFDNHVPCFEEFYRRIKGPVIDFGTIKAGHRKFFDA